MTEVKVSINGKKGSFDRDKEIEHKVSEKENSYLINYSKNPRFKKILEELEVLIGLGKVKEKIKEICALIEIQSMRREEGLISEPQSLHMIFKGNPFFTG